MNNNGNQGATLRLPASVIRKLEQRAAALGISVSGYLKLLIEADLRNRL